MSPFLHWISVASDESVLLHPLAYIALSSEDNVAGFPSLAVMNLGMSMVYTSLFLLYVYVTSS